MAKPTESSIVTKCAQILDILAAARAPMKFSEIVQKTGYVKSSCHRILAILAGERLVTYDKISKTYQTGSRLNDWSRWAWRRVDLQEIAGTEMRLLSERLSVNVALSVLDNNTILYLRTVDHFPVRFAAAMGDHAPLHCTAAGKVFLAHMSEARRKRVLAEMEFVRMTEQTITNASDLMNELPDVIKHGYARAAREEFLHVWGIAAPIWGEDRAISACLSLWTTGNGDKAEPDLLANVEMLKQSTERISRALGWTPRA